MSLRLRLIVCLLTTAVLCGCGMPGAPQMPSLQLARPVEDLTASRAGNQVTLEWTLPRKNTDRTLVKHALETRICRHAGTALMSTCTVVGQMLPRKPLPRQKGETQPEAIKMHYEDTLPPELGKENPTGFVTYAVEELNLHGHSAGLSNQVPIPVAPTIPAPQDLKVQVGAEGVRVSWSGPEPPAAPAGLHYQYQIDRRPVGAPAYIVVGDVEPSADGSYLDRTSAWEAKYQYRITTITTVQSHGLNASVPGDSSQPVEVFTRDIYPPGQPAGLQAVFSSVGQKPFIDLTWAPNMEGDLAGYNVYRRTEGGQFQKVNKQLVTVPSFRDDNVQAGVKYVYCVSAVDLRGNESPRSAEAAETAAETR